MPSIIDPTDAPIPGASLTSSPEERGSWEKPPKFTDPQNAIEELFFRLINNEENLENVLDLMRSGTPVEDIAQVLLYTGFTEGLWTPDLILVLAEPLMYILLNLAELTGIEAVIYPEEDFEFDKESNSSRLARLRSKAGTVDPNEAEDSVLANLNEPDIVPRSLLQRLQEAVGDQAETQGIAADGDRVADQTGEQQNGN